MLDIVGVDPCPIEALSRSHWIMSLERRRLTWMVERMRQIGSVAIHQGDCLEVLPTLKERFTGVLSDPPYGLFFMSKRWDKGVPGIPFWSAIREQCLPGAYMLAFGGTRTYHRQTCAIEDSGWVIRDCLMWIYGSGFPKSLDLSKSIDKSLGVEREVVGVKNKGAMHGGAWGNNYRFKSNHIITGKPSTPQSKLWDGYGTAIKPAYEPVGLAMNPRDGSFTHNALEHGCGGLNIDGCRIEANEKTTFTNRTAPRYSGRSYNGRECDKRSNIASCDPKGRWPANILIDDSPEVVRLFPDSYGGTHVRNCSVGYHGSVNDFQSGGHDIKGSAARFYYCAKASRAEREAGCDDIDPLKRDETREDDSPGGNNPRNRGAGLIHNNHPTVKPVALMRYLLRLITQPSHNSILDPFAGSGTTGVACALAGLPCVLIEKDRRHWEICCARVQWAVDLRRRLGREPALDLSPYQRPARSAPGGGQLSLGLGGGER